MKAFAASPRVIVGDADHDHLEYAGVGIDRLLDHLRIDVEAAEMIMSFLRSTRKK